MILKLIIMMLRKLKRLTSKQRRHQIQPDQHWADFYLEKIIY